VVSCARDRALAAIAVCDHDSVDGIRAAIEAEGKYDVEVVPGIELSTEIGDMEVHILGYFYEWENKQFQALMKTIQQVRIWRAELMVSKLRQLGFNMDFQEVLREAEGGSIGRPHIARVMLRRGYVKDNEEAFGKYLKYGAPAYVDKYEMSPEQAIYQITRLKGVPVLAHPKFSPFGEDVLARFVKSGLKGIEVYHSRHSEAESRQYLGLAEKYGLIATGGSDSHGDEDPIGCARVPYEAVEKLKAERRKLLFGE
jgi:predicted metal-dependent phosphoesterase TrpH